jgi:hypothetical protein
MISSRWRRALGGIAFLGAVALLATQTCKSESLEAQIRFRVGDTGAELRSLRAELYRGEDPDQIGFYEKNFDQRGSGELVGPWIVRADPGLYRLEITARTASGSRQVTRSVDLVDEAAITVDLVAP